MNWIIAIIVALLFVGPLVFILLSGKTEAKRAAKRTAKGSAKIVSAEQLNPSPDGYVSLALEIIVTPTSGDGGSATSVRGKKDVKILHASRMQKDADIPIRFDPQEPQNFAFEFD